MSNCVKYNSRRVCISKFSPGFTIVELLVVIVVIGILASITIISYNGVGQKATVASVKSDLTNASRQLKLYQVDHGSYPTSFDANNCPLGTDPSPDIRYCLKASTDTTFSDYQSTNNNQSFSLTATKNGISYTITDSTEPAVAVVLTVPVLTSPTANSNTITNTGAILGATITSDGGAPITDNGVCWGATANPTTNCSSLEFGALTPLSTSGIVNPNVFSGVAITPRGIAISPDSKTVYTSSYNYGKIAMFSRDLTTGILPSIPTFVDPIPAYGYGFDVVVSFDGKSVYVTNDAYHYISMFSRDEATGVLDYLNPKITNVDQTNPRDMAISPDGKSIYIVNYSSATVSMFNRDIVAGLLNNLGYVGTFGNPFRVIVSTDNRSVYATDNSNYIFMYGRNLDTGVLEPLSTPYFYIGGGTNNGIAVSTDHKSVYVTSYDTGKIFVFSRDITSGILTLSNTINTGASTHPNNIAVSDDNKSVYVINQGSVSMYSRNIDTGALTALTVPTVNSGSDGGSGLGAIIASPDGKSVYTSDSVNSTLYMYGRNTRSGIFAQAKTGMTTGTEYHYRAYATNSVGTGYSTDATFTAP